MRFVRFEDARDGRCGETAGQHEPQQYYHQLQAPHRAQVHRQSHTADSSVDPLRNGPARQRQYWSQGTTIISIHSFCGYLTY